MHGKKSSRDVRKEVRELRSTSLQVQIHDDTLDLKTEETILQRVMKWWVVWISFLVLVLGDVKAVVILTEEEPLPVSF